MCNSMHYSVHRNNTVHIDNTGVTSEQRLLTNFLGKYDFHCATHN